MPQLLAVTALLNAAVALYIYALLPEFLLRLLSWLLVRIVYRVSERGLSNIPEEGAALGLQPRQLRGRAGDLLRLVTGRYASSWRARSSRLP